MRYISFKLGRKPHSSILPTMMRNLAMERTFTNAAQPAKLYKRRKNISKPPANINIHDSTSVDVENGAHATPPRHAISDPSVRVKVLNEYSHTPMPNFDAMDDAEIKLQLDRIGMRPIGRAKAVRMLKRVYEAVHPMTEVGAGTPLTQRVSRALLRTQKRPLDAARAEKAREKRIRKALANVAPTTVLHPDQATDESAFSANSLNNVATWPDEAEAATVATSSSATGLSSERLKMAVGSGAIASFSSSSLQSVNADNQAPPKRNQDQLIRTFLEWLRMPDNEDLYYDLLMLNPILFERLAVDFGEELRAQRISRVKFADMLDRLHVTYCVPQHDNGHY